MAKRRTQGMHWIRDEKRLAIYMRDGLACAYCGRGVEHEEKLTLDHLKPYSKGGSNEAGNLVTCCSHCNSSRQDRPLAAWLRAVADYTNESADDLARRIRRLRKKCLDILEAKNMIARRGGWIFKGEK